MILGFVSKHVICLHFFRLSGIFFGNKKVCHLNVEHFLYFQIFRSFKIAIKKWVLFLLVCLLTGVCEYCEYCCLMLLISLYSFHTQSPYLILLFVVMFSVTLQGFLFIQLYTYILSANRDNFTSFPICVSLYFWSLTGLASIPRTMLDSRGDQGRPGHVSDSNGMLQAVPFGGEGNIQLFIIH